jgi:hypothetical protein
MLLPPTASKICTLTGSAPPGVDWMILWFYGATALLALNAAPRTLDTDRSRLCEIVPRGAGKGEAEVSNGIFKFDETCWKRHLGRYKVSAENGSKAMKLKTGKRREGELH